MKKLLLLIGLATLTQPSLAQIREFQTTRLLSTAGAGVGSILSTEAAILNPASSAFFSGSSASYQRYRTTLRDKSEVRDAASDPFAKRNPSQGIFLSDHSSEVKGGVAYIQQDENDFHREQVIFHSATPISTNASFGFSYHYIQDKLPREFASRHQVHHQLTAGFTYIVDEETTLGLVLHDPTRTTPGEERLLTGFQYNLASRLSLIADIGAKYTEDVTQEYLWRAAVQINIFSDFFLRGGKFYDNIREFKGMGWGIGWMGPRFGVEFGQRIAEQFGRSGYVYQDETLVDTALSAMIKI